MAGCGGGILVAVVVVESDDPIRGRGCAPPFNHAYCYPRPVSFIHFANSNTVL